MSVKLRKYQEECVQYFQASWRLGVLRPPAVLSTGAGKTVIFTHPKFVNPFLDNGKRVLIIAHTDELIEQAARAARRGNPRRRVGIVKAASNQTTADIIVSSRQTLGHATGGPRRLAQLRNVGLIIIDEAHHAVRGNTYGKILDHFGCFECEACKPVGRNEWCDTCHGVEPPVVAGFTATLARGDKQKLSSVWQEPEGGIFRRDILYFIRRGFLLDVRGKRVVVPDLNMANVRQVAGDYQDSAIAEELERTFAPEIVAEQYNACARTTDGVLRKGIAFWPLVDTAYHAAKAFNDAGIPSEVIHGNLAKPERRAILARLHSGETTVVHGVGVLTEGFDEPTCDVVVIGRPTRSAPLYQQMVGRVLRPDLTVPAEQRLKALILDVVGAGMSHDLRSLVDLAPERMAGVNPMDEDSLLEIEDMLFDLEEEIASSTGGQMPEFAEDYRGDTAVIEFDPLGRERVWSQTGAGNYFMTAGSVGYAFLVESVAGDPGTWDVVLCSKLSIPRDGVIPWAKQTEHTGIPLEMALGEAEELAMEVGGFGSKALASKKSKWRSEPPNDRQKSLARSLGVWIEGMSKGETSQAIDTAKATNRIDPLVSIVKSMGAKV